jgi:hypothetical protein
MKPISEESFTHFYYDELFAGETVNLDGGWFERCRFDACNIVFEGSRPFGFVACTFGTNVIAIDGAARQIMTPLVSNFPRSVVDALIADLRQS